MIIFLSQSEPTVCAVLSSVCATSMDNSGVYVYYLKGIVSVCFRCPANERNVLLFFVRLCCTVQASQ